MKIGQKGFTVVEGLLIVIALTLIGFTGFYVYNANKDDKKSSESTQSTSNESQKQTSEPDATAGWKNYSDKYVSFKYPSSWVMASNPERCSSGIVLLGIDTEHVGACGSDNGGQMSIAANEGDQRNNTWAKENYDNYQETPVTINGAAGTKMTGTFKSNGEPVLGATDGEKVLRYTIFTKGMTYTAVYNEQPGESYPEAKTNFQTLVEKTLKFTVQ